MGRLGFTAGWAVILLLVAGGAPARAGASIEVVESVPVETELNVKSVRETRDVWLEMIRAARASIVFEQFYVSSPRGKAMEPVIDALRDAASRGVRIRGLVDKSFLRHYSEDPERLNRVPGIEVRAADFSDEGGVQHAKYFVVDGREAYVGSANFDWLALDHIHETGVRVGDPATASALSRIFERDWSDAGPLGGDFKPLAWDFGALSDIRLIASPPSRTPRGIDDSIHGILELISSARDRVRVQVYKYTTSIYGSSGRWRVLQEALREAAGRGVRVELMVDSVALRGGGEELHELASTHGVEVRQVVIPEWSGGHLDYARLIHSKYLTADGRAAWVGTENWAENYFSISRNVGLVLKEAGVTRDLDRIFSKLWESPYASAL